MSDLREYELRVEGLERQSISDSNYFKSIVDEFKRFNVYYTARDTRILWPDCDNTATLVYTCSEWNCPSCMRFTVTHNVLTRVECNWYTVEITKKSC